jgi:hypothetical protein
MENLHTNSSTTWYVTKWFHTALNYCGLHWLLKTMGLHLYHPRLRILLQSESQRTVTYAKNRNYPGHNMPPRQADLLPWEEVAVDLIGPWTVKLPNETYNFMALTCIDPATNFPDASWATIHCTLGMSPGGIVFKRDMLLNIPLLTDFQLLQTRQQTIIDDNLWCTNNQRCQHDYQPGDECLILDHKATGKLDAHFIGPFTIIHTHVNGTITIQQTPHVTDRVNIHQVKPYFRNG